MRILINLSFLFFISLHIQAQVSLDGSWRLHYGKYDKDSPVNPGELESRNWPEIAASVPGNVEIDLQASGIIKNPEVGNNINDLRKFESYQWWYSKTFKTPRTADNERVELLLEGLDCFGNIWINNKFVGKTDNMLIDHRFDITNFLTRDGNNVIHIRIDPVVAQSQQYINGVIGARKFFRVEQVHVRKAPHMYGWDIMPRLISAGLWKSVSLEIKKATRLEQVYWMTDVADVPNKKAQLLLDWQFSTDRYPIEGLKMEVSLKSNSQTIFQNSYPLYNHCSRQMISLENVEFWWPKGYGEPSLYEATVTIVDETGQILDRKIQKVGIRTAELIYTDLTTKENPGEFLVKINGEKIFIRGTNWVPLDALHSRDRHHLANAFKMIEDLNCNMIRCWGGNVYEDQQFYDLCDQNGIMVWQDFSFAGTVYPQDSEFAEKVRKEAINVVLKLRYHPSLVLWCGNNEIDISIGWIFSKPINPGLDRVSRDVLPRVVWEYDPIRTYLPSSPYCSEELFKQGNNIALMPQVHLWGPRGYYKIPFYTDVNAHFVAEIGYHGCPNRSSLERMFDPDYVYPWSSTGDWNDQWQTKAVSCHPNSTLTIDRNNLMIRQVYALFGDTLKDLDQFIFASQVVQAEAMKFFVELWRMEKFRKTGIIWWNLRDGWPIISDAVVDYYNSKKLAYYYIRQVQYNSCVMIGDPKDGNHPVVAVNDTRDAKSGSVIVRDADSGKMLFSQTFEIPVNGKTLVGNIPETDQRGMWLIEYMIGNQKYTNHYLAGKAPFKLDDYRRWYNKLNLHKD